MDNSVKIEKLFTRKRYVFKSKKLKQVLGIAGKERVTNLGCWQGLAPVDEGNKDPDEFELWYVETEDGDKD